VGPLYVRVRVTDGSVRTRPLYPFKLQAVNYTTTLDSMAHWERDVQSLLRPSERLLFTLEGSYLQHGLESDSETSTPISPDKTSLGSSEETPVILAIVGHVDHAMGESGRLILDTSAYHSMLNNL
jgi:hypothetical protein